MEVSVEKSVVEDIGGRDEDDSSSLCLSSIHTYIYEEEDGNCHEKDYWKEGYYWKETNLIAFLNLPKKSHLGPIFRNGGSISFVEDIS